MKLLSELKKEARPREKMLLKGASGLTDVELLAILLGTGGRGRDVLQLAAEILPLIDQKNGKLRPEDSKSPVDDYKLMQSIVAELVEIYPDGAPFELDLQLYKDEQDRFKTGFEAFWKVLIQSERYSEMRAKWWEREKEARAMEAAHKKSTNQVVNAAKKLRKKLS